MRDEAKERLELLSTIQDLGYESLRYSIFNEYGLGEWEVVIEYDDSKQVYNVYATMDRASKGGIFDFTDFFQKQKRNFYNFWEILFFLIVIMFKKEWVRCIPLHYGTILRLFQKRLLKTTRE